MDRIDKILKHDLFLQHLEKNNMAEAERRFCRHNMVHFLDVARIAWIYNLEEELAIDREIVYAAALLHDMGKHIQYENGTPHEETGSAIAAKILPDCGFSAKETALITDAILNHRNGAVRDEKSLRGILYRADKASRACFACPVERECKWGSDKKNIKLKV
jgi:putative nucleotidyltransferase with HDIG domain